MKTLPFSSVDRRGGFVIANSSSRGDAVNKDVAGLWAKPCRGIDPEREQHWQSVLVEPSAQRNLTATILFFKEHLMR